MESKALIFIPDISGYTKFVNETETRHSKHIITELLEVIINANILKLQISEIEGDAVLFFLKGKPPKLTELLSQVKKMFLAFHTQVKIIERDNICQCGACRTAVNLTLKFITHYGTIEEITVQNFQKIMGSDVILTHRLLKNNIDEKEYFLITQNYFGTPNIPNTEIDPWVKFKDNSEKYEEFDIVQTRYTSLEEIRKEIPKPHGNAERSFHFTKPDFSIYIKAPMFLIYEILIDVNEKRNIGSEVKEITSDSKINRINATHKCVFEDFEIDFVTKSSEFNDKEIYFAEEGQMSKGTAFINIFKLEGENTRTKVSVKILPTKFTGKLPFFQKLISGMLSRLMIFKIRKATEESGKLFKDYCEKVALDRAS